MTDQEAIKIIKHKVGRFQNDTINDALDMAINALEEVQQYRSIGTLYECRLAVEKMKPKRPINRCMFSECPTCGNVEIKDCKHCPDCGQALIL